jgi:hypothetical protein
MHAHARAKTAVEAWIRHVITALLVLVTETVVEAVTAREDRQAVARLRHTAVVSVGARLVSRNRETSMGKSDHQRRTVG